jgi:hypothetical protein
MAAPAALKVTTPRSHPFLRGPHDLFHSRPRKTRPLLDKRCFQHLARKNKRHKHRFSPATLVRWQTRQAITAINQFFDSELQTRILCPLQITLPTQCLRDLRG